MVLETPWVIRTGVELSYLLTYPCDPGEAMVNSGKIEITGCIHNACDHCPYT